MGQGLPKAVTSVAVKRLDMKMPLISFSFPSFSIHFQFIFNSCPLTEDVSRRVGGTAFRVGFAEMNGWRPSMEDANVIYAQDTWGFFGVFDGHGGDQCSGFIARRIKEELEKNGMPSDDEALTALALRLDKEFLDSNQPSGSTGTFVIVKAPTTPGGEGFSPQTAPRTFIKRS